MIDLPEFASIALTVKRKMLNQISAETWFILAILNFFTIVPMLSGIVVFAYTYMIGNLPCCFMEIYSMDSYSVDVAR